MKTKNKLSAYILRGSTAALLFSCVIVALSSATNLPEQPRKIPPPQDNAAFGANAYQSRTLSFADRVAHQRAIERVYWRHRIWPDTNPGPKPSLDAMMSQAQIEKKVEDYLRNSQALEDYWQRPARNASHNDAGGPITADQLQTEMERMASHTKQPEVLRELFEALGNDPFVIAECLARAVLTQRLVTELKNEERVELTTVAWLRDPVQSGRATAETQAPKEVAAIDSIAKAIQVNRPYTLPVIASPLGGCTDGTWTATSTSNAPAARTAHTAVWTGSEMIVWGGAIGGPTFFNTGGRYNPTTDSWTATSTTNAPDARGGHTAVWTGSEMIVWGGVGADYFNTGGRYNPSTDSWTATTLTNAPAATTAHTAVWTGSEMIIWGGNFGGQTGGRYNPGTDSWTATSTTNAPDARFGHTAVWTGSEMIVWGGFGGFGDLNTGGRYNPNTDSWTATSTTNAPDGREQHAAVWTGSEMIVWGGVGGADYFNTGGRYSPSTDSWMATSTANAPDGRELQPAVWTGSQMIVWGGYNGSNYFNTGGRYNPSIDAWAATTITNAPDGRFGHTAVWTDREMIVWGGFDILSFFNTGGRYCDAALRPIPTPRPRPTPAPRP
jgi:N-acetylneuraminic acid mutarotase